MPDERYSASCFFANNVVTVGLTPSCLGPGTNGVGPFVGVASTIGGVSSHLVTLANNRFLGLSHAFYFSIALALVLWYVLDLTPVRRRL